MAIQNLATLSALASTLYLFAKAEQHHECDVKALAAKQDHVWDDMKSAPLRFLRLEEYDADRLQPLPQS